MQIWWKMPYISEGEFSSYDKKHFHYILSHYKPDFIHWIKVIYLHVHRLLFLSLCKISSVIFDLDIWHIFTLFITKWSKSELSFCTLAFLMTRSLYQYQGICRCELGHLWNWPLSRGICVSHTQLVKAMKYQILSVELAFYIYTGCYFCPCGKKSEVSFSQCQNIKNPWSFVNWIWYSLSKLWISSLYSGVDVWFSCVIQQYYRKARQIAVARGYPDLAGKEEEILQSKKFMYPRPASAPSSPSNSRSTTPAPSEHGDDDEEDDIDEDEENAELNSNPEADRPTFKWRKGRNSLLLRVQTDGSVRRFALCNGKLYI